jgi:hypothetical protein
VRSTAPSNPEDVARNLEGLADGKDDDLGQMLAEAAQLIRELGRAAAPRLWLARHRTLQGGWCSWSGHVLTPDPDGSWAPHNGQNCPLSCPGAGVTVTDPAQAALAALRTVELWQSSDDVKRDLELVCLTCGEHLCDAQHKDSLDTLAGMAGDHEHHFQVLEFYSYAPGDLIETIQVGTWDPATGIVATDDGEQLGAAKTADEARMLFGDVCDGAVYWEPFDHEEDPDGQR